jgi:hypothetical protein
MARNSKSSAKAERADHRRPPDERMDREAIAGLLPPEELDRPADSRLTAGDLKRAAAKAKGVMGASKKLDPDLNIVRTRGNAGISNQTDGTKKSRAASTARRGLDKGSAKATGAGTERIRRTKSNAEIAESVTSTARKSPAPRATWGAVGATADAIAQRQSNKRTGEARQRAPASGNVTRVTKREAVTGQPPSRKTGNRSTSSSGGAKPPKRSARAGTSRGGARSKGA